MSGTHCHKGRGNDGINRIRAKTFFVDNKKNEKGQREAGRDGTRFRPAIWNGRLLGLKKGLCKGSRYNLIASI
jgi:hypothetical protein